MGSLKYHQNKLERVLLQLFIILIIKKFKDAYDDSKRESDNMPNYLEKENDDFPN